MTGFPTRKEMHKVMFSFNDDEEQAEFDRLYEQQQASYQRSRNQRVPGAQRLAQRIVQYGDQQIQANLSAAAIVEAEEQEFHRPRQDRDSQFGL